MGMTRRDQNRILRNKWRFAAVLDMWDTGRMGNMMKYRRIVPLLLALAALAIPAHAKSDMGSAIFAGGCFWCMEAAYDEVPGVISTTSGYTGGHKINPTYEQVSAGGTGHAESVRVIYDPTQIGYKQLLTVFWRNIDPTVTNRQFCDQGSQYRAAIFVRNDTQRALAEASLQALEQDSRFAGKIVTQIETADTFFPAEEYHQNFHIKNPIRYHTYKFGCGRAQKLKRLWGNEAGGPYHE